MIMTNTEKDLKNAEDLKRYNLQLISKEVSPSVYAKIVALLDVCEKLGYLKEITKYERSKKQRSVKEKS